MGEAQAQSEHSNSETVWEILMEDREHLRETDRILKESAEQHAADIREIRRINKETADFSLENYDKVMLVEVKVKPDIDDIEYHIRRIEKFRAYADLHGDRHIFLGAVAGTVINDNVKNFALKNGLYIIQPSGETFIITVPEGIYSPREW